MVLSEGRIGGLYQINIELSISCLSDGVCWNGLCRSGMHQSCYRGVPTQLHHRVDCVKDSGVAQRKFLEIMLSLTLLPGGVVVHCQAPFARLLWDCSTVNAGSGSVGNGPAVWPACWHTFRI